MTQDADTLLPCAWEIVRQDRDDGGIAYEVWQLKPYTFLFAIYDDITAPAKSIAESIVAAHNRRERPPADADLIEKCAKVAESYADYSDRNRGITPETQALIIRDAIRALATDRSTQ